MVEHRGRKGPFDIINPVAVIPGQRLQPPEGLAADEAQTWRAIVNARSLTGQLNRSNDGVFEIVRVVGRRLVSIAEVHAVVARAHLAQSEPEMARNRFGFLERQSRQRPCRYTFIGLLLSRFGPCAGFVTLRQNICSSLPWWQLPLRGAQG